MTNFNEKLRDRTIRHMVFLERLKTREVNQILKVVDDEIIPDLVDRLRVRLARIEDFGFDRGNATTQRIAQLIDQLRDITDRFRDFNTRVQGELFELAIDEVNWQIGVIREELNFDLDFVTPPAEIVRASIVNTPFDGRTLEQWFDTLANATQDKLQQTITRGVVEGRSTDQIVRELRGTRALNYTDGVLNTTRAQTAAVIRTAVTHTSANARQQMFDANADLMNGVQWIATLDSRTTFICQSRDGQVYPVESKIRPPAHVNCRSSVVPVLKSWEELGIEAEALDSQTRASVDGQVPSTTTYPEWLRGQPRSVVEDALGVQKAALFLDGKLEINRFITPAGRELTLEQLRKKEAGAFRRAGL